jgi:hypothetical protein
MALPACAGNVMRKQSINVKYHQTGHFAFIFYGFFQYFKVGGDWVSITPYHHIFKQGIATAQSVSKNCSIFTGHHFT